MKSRISLRLGFLEIQNLLLTHGFFEIQNLELCELFSFFCNADVLAVKKREYTTFAKQVNFTKSEIDRSLEKLTRLKMERETEGQISDSVAHYTEKEYRIEIQILLICMEIDCNFFQTRFCLVPCEPIFILFPYYLDLNTVVIHLLFWHSGILKNLLTHLLINIAVVICKRCIYGVLIFLFSCLYASIPPLYDLKRWVYGVYLRIPSSTPGLWMTVLKWGCSVYVE